MLHAETIHSFCPAAAKINFVFNGEYFHVPRGLAIITPTNAKS